MFTDLITASEAATLLSISRATLFRLVASGEIDSVSLTRPGTSRGARRFSKTAVLIYSARKTSEQRPRKKPRLPAAEHAAILREGNELRAQVAKLTKDLKKAIEAGGALAHQLSRKASVDPVVQGHRTTLENLRLLHIRGEIEAP